MPFKNVPLGIGVKYSPFLTMKILAVAVSATLPSASQAIALENPFSCASYSILALLG
jgi:hypothetical protein